MTSNLEVLLNALICINSVIKKKYTVNFRIFTHFFFIFWIFHRFFFAETLYFKYFYLTFFSQTIHNVIQLLFNNFKNRML